MTTLTTAHKAVLIDLTDDKEIMDFLNSQKKSTRTSYGAYFRRLKEYDPSITGKQLLKDRKLWERRIFDFQRYLIEERKYSITYVQSVMGSLRGFFSSNRRPLIFIPSEKRRLSEKVRKTQDYSFTKEDIEKMSNVGNLKEKWVLLVGKSLGLRAEDFSKITYGQIRSIKLDGEAPVFLGEIATEKESVKAFAFIDSDALPVVRNMIETNTGKKDDEEVWTAHSQELSYALQSLMKKTNIQVGSRRVRFHCLRKFLIDCLSDFSSSEKWKQIVGKSISESAYVSPNKLRECYFRAMTESCFTNAAATKEELQSRDAQIRTLLESQTKLKEELRPLVDALERAKKLNPDMDGREVANQIGEIIGFLDGRMQIDLDKMNIPIYDEKTGKKVEKKDAESKNKT